MRSAPPAPWLLLQLADAAFPAGGFAHSAGLEAAIQLGGEVDVPAFLDQTLGQTARFSLPFVRAACEDPSRIAELDALVDASVLSHVANRASRAQGRALASAASRVFDERVAPIADHARCATAHLGPVFGALYGALGLSTSDACIAFLHGTARGVLSAAVRLGALGPLEAQRLQRAAAPRLDAMLADALASPAVDDAASTAPLLELYGALHDRLDGRLFQS
jgi:urease accessory protein